MHLIFVMMIIASCRLQVLILEHENLSQWIIAVITLIVLVLMSTMKLVVLMFMFWLVDCLINWFS